MGLLDDAIREHLELKRRRGADPTEVERLEQEALGPVRRGPQEAAIEVDEAAVASYTDEPGEEEEVSPYADEPEWSEPDDELAPPDHELAPSEDDHPGVSEAAAQPEAGDRALFDHEADFEPSEGGSASRAEQPPAPPADHPVAAPEAAPPPIPASSDYLAQETAEYDVEAEHALEQDATDEHPAQPSRRRRPGGEEPEEDVLEETPEFLQDTPDHDRLWFEQRPPRDFDFDD